MATNDEGDFWGTGKGKQPSKSGGKSDGSGGTPEGGFWSSPGSKGSPQTPSQSTSPNAGGADFWNKAEAKRQHEVKLASMPADEHKRLRKRRRRKIVLISLGSVLLLILLLVALAPTIAGMVAPGVIQKQAAKQIAGRVQVEKTSFGWLGPQRIDKFKLLDKEGKLVATASIEAQTGLFGLAFGKLNLGTITLEGVKADIIKYQDGSTNIDRAIAPKQQPAKSSTSGPAQKPGEIRIPDSLHVKVAARNMEVSFTDLTRPGASLGTPTVLVSKADLDARAGAGDPLVVKLSAKASAGSGETGSIAVDVTADKLIRNDGLVQPAKASLDASIKLAQLPLALADAFVTLPENASIREGLGETIDVTLAAKGTLSDATAQLRAAATNLQANADLRVANGVLTTPSPLQLKINGQAIRTLTPQIDAALKAQDNASIEEFPDVTLQVANLKVPVPDGRDLDLRGSSAEITLDLSETRGTVKLSGEQAESFRIEPLHAKVVAPDLAQGAHITASTKATLSEQPAGDLSVDLKIADLLDAKGAPIQGPPGTINGTLAVRNIATAIAQPFLAATKVNLPQDIGPTLNIEAKASSDMRGVAAGTTPPTDVTIAVSSEALKVQGGVQLSQAEIRSAGEGIKLEVNRPAQIASRFVDASTGFQVAPTTEKGRQQGVVVTLKELIVPRNPADGQLLLDKAGAHLEVAVSGIVVSRVGEAHEAQPAARTVDGQPGSGQPGALALNNAVITSELAPGGHAKLVMNAAMVYGGAGFVSKADFAIPSLLVVQDGQAGMASPGRIHPVGKFELRDMPTALARMFLRTSPSAHPDGKPLDLAKLIGDTLGPAVSVTLTTSLAQGSKDATNALIGVKTATTVAEVSADVAETQLALRKFAVQTSVTPQTVTGLTQAFAPDVAGVPRLAGPSRIIVQVDPMTIPMRDFAPMLDRAGTLGARVSIPGRTLVEGLQVTNEDGSKRDLGRVGIDSFELGAKVPIAATVGEALPDERKVTATLSGTILGSAEEALTELSGNLATEINNGQLAGPMSSDLKLMRINTGLLEQLAGQPGMISGAIGSFLSVQLATSTTPPRNAAGGFDFTQATTDAQLTLDAPRLKSDGPISARIAPGSATLVKPVKMVMAVDPAWMNRFFEKPRPAGAIAGPAQHDLKLMRETSLTITLSKLTYPIHSEGAPPTYLEAGLGLSIPQLQFMDSENREIQMSQLAVQVDATPIRQGSNAESSVPVHIKLDVAETMVVGVDSSAKAMTLRALVEGLLRADGGVTPDSGLVSLNGDLPAIPTAIIDSLAKKDGLIVDALGPVASVKVEVERFPLSQMKHGAESSPPVISASAESQRAKATLRGTIRDNVYVSERPLEVTVTELTEDLAKRLVKILPLFGTVSKSSTDAPALIVGTKLTVPLSDEMTKLNGEFRIDPGEARFSTSEGFGNLLKGMNQQQSGLVGRRLEPLTIHVVQGVATYERWTVPLGQFDVKTEGTVDLVKRQIDVVTYVPFGELSESAAGVLNSSLNQVLGRAGATLVNAATVVPIRTSGPLDKPTTGIDSKAFLENVRKNLKPEDLIKEGVGDLLKDQLKPKK